MQILLIRHGESKADILKVHEGRADFSLTKKGHQQVKKLAEVVKTKYSANKIYSSTLIRAKETAEVIADNLNKSIIFEDDLMEQNNGILAGMPLSEVNNVKKPCYLHESIQDGESAIDFRLRIEKVFSKIIVENEEERRVAIVTHGGVINCILRAFYNMPVNQEYWFQTGDTGFHLLEIKETEKNTHFLNNMSHLDSLKI
ncbi:histidine phosphatase family protein [Oceanobacillus sp. CFH 90083]|uniref:histidine phosphatase family protein n=1 Tax=Oceanobacillus sp. CFH 90083 TaxID=2592336 RepID=UPI00128B34DD|nr:histidine phosphatase family protein [Oceanobacillus sp. CFH 90083]